MSSRYRALTSFMWSGRNGLHGVVVAGRIVDGTAAVDVPSGSVLLQGGNYVSRGLLESVDASTACTFPDATTTDGGIDTAHTDEYALAEAEGHYPWGMSAALTAAIAAARAR